MYWKRQKVFDKILNTTIIGIISGNIIVKQSMNHYMEKEDVQVSVADMKCICRKISVQQNELWGRDGQLLPQLNPMWHCYMIIPTSCIYKVQGSLKLSLV